MEFQKEIKEGEKIRFQNAKKYLQSTRYFNEIKKVANGLHVKGYKSQARQFVYTAYVHIRQRDWDRYHFIVSQYRSLLNESI